MASEKYTPQKKYRKNNYKQFPIDFKPEVLEEFKAICSELGTSPTTEIKKFVEKFIELHR